MWTAYHDPRSIDDFWHAAVNGRGKYFRASDPQSVVAGLSEALAQIGSTLATGSGTSVPNSPQNIGSGADKFTLSTSYNAGNWTGELTYNTWKNDKELSPQAVWSAQAKLQTQVDVDCDDRRIYVKDGSQLVQFAKGTKVCTGGLTLDSIPTAIANALNLTSLNQYTAMTNGSGGTALQQQAVTVASFVNYIRGHKKNEGYAINNVNKLYRSREFVLGDIAGSVPTYVAGPKESYVDAGYVAFKEAKKSRKPVVYVGANDGMLHAFNADASDAAKGKELWAYIPSQVIPNLIHLAGDNYKYNHRFYVDGTPIVGDVKINNDWKTILVGGLNAGGNGYYALDVTDPDSPKALWEFTTHVDSEVGLSFGEPRIVKLEDGRWVVLVSSGHNNSTGKGYLYVLSAETGQVLHKIATNVGSAVSPSGLTHISPYMTYKGLTAKVSHVYAGDLFGNVWRFDMSGSTAFTAKKLTQLKDSGGKEQPITTEIQAIKNEGQVRLFIGTGKLLDFSDLAQVSDVQSIYGIVDTSSTSMDPAYDAALKAGMGRTVLAQLSSTSAGATISIACKAQCDAVTKTPWSGWYFDLPEKGERINVNMQTDPLGQNLAAVSNYPAQGSVNNVCKSNVASSLYVFNLLTSKGSGVKNSTAAVALPIYTTGENADGNSVIYVQPMSSNPETKLPAVELSQVRKAAGQKRISWREVVQQ